MAKSLTAESARAKARADKILNEVGRLRAQPRKNRARLDQLEKEWKEITSSKDYLAALEESP